MRDYDVRIEGEPYHFGQRGGLTVGKTALEPGGSVPRAAIGTSVIASLHHGPGQAIAGDTKSYLWGDKVVLDKPGLIYPAGGFSNIYTSDADDSDGIHGYSFFEVDNKLFLITPKRVIKIATDTDTVSIPAATTLTPPNVYTGSWARWRGKIILGVEKTPATPIGGDSSARYAESGAAPVIYDIATDAFAALGSPDAWEFVSHIVSARGTLWWVQNRGLYGPPELYWTDKADTDFGSITAADTYGPFRIEQGGYSTSLFMAGPHILVFKRDGSIIGVDEQKIWIPYSPPRSTVTDDLFGHGTVQYRDVLIIPDNTGALVFSPNVLSLNSIEPYDIQEYPAYLSDKFMAKARVFTVRGQELYAIGETKEDSVTMYVANTYAQEGFFYSSDYGIFAAPTVLLPTGGFSHRVRKIGGGSVVRPISSTRDTVRKASVAVTIAENPVAAHSTRHTSGGEHYHVYAATERTTDGRTKLYRIDLYPPGQKYAPVTFPAMATLVTSKMSGNDTFSGITKIPLQLRGYIDLTAISEGGSPVQKVRFLLASDEGSFTLVGEVSQTGFFSLSMPDALAGVPGRTFSVRMEADVGQGFRIELPFYFDFLASPTSTEDSDDISVKLEIGGPGDRLTMRRGIRPHEPALDTLLNLRNSKVVLEFHWGATWDVWVENVNVQQLRNDKGSLPADGKYVVTLLGRRV